MISLTEFLSWIEFSKTVLKKTAFFRIINILHKLSTANNINVIEIWLLHFKVQLHVIQDHCSFKIVPKYFSFKIVYTSLLFTILNEHICK